MKSIKAYKYRWVILLSLMALTIGVEMQWVAFAPITRVASLYYEGQFDPQSLFTVDFLSLIYMVIFVVLAIPAAYAVNRLGIKLTLRTAAVLIIAGSLGKLAVPQSFLVIIICQVLLAIAQPIVLTSVTAVTARWFPIRDRGAAAGMVSLTQYFAIAVVMIVSPLVVGSNPLNDDYGMGIDRLLLIYGIVSTVLALAAFFLVRERPPTPASYLEEEKLKFGSLFSWMKKEKSYLNLLIIFGLGWGMMLAIINKTDSVNASLGFPRSSGLLAIVFFCAGMVGSILIPWLSDRFKKRKLFLLICIIGAMVGITLITFATQLEFWVFSVRIIALIGAGLFGFFMLSAGPLGSQYAAELGGRVPEAATQGALMFLGQFFGMVYLFVMDFSGGSLLQPMLIAMTATMVVILIGAIFMKESPMIITEEERLKEAVDKEIVHHV